MAHSNWRVILVLGKAAIGMARVARSSDVKRTFRRSLADLDSGIPDEFAPNMKNHGIRSRPFFLSSDSLFAKGGVRGSRSRRKRPPLPHMPGQKPV